MGTISVRLFGSPEVVRDGAPVGVDTRKALAVFAVIALAGHPVRRDTLAGLLWPDVRRNAARLTRTLSSLRSLIGAEAVVPTVQTVSLTLESSDDVLSFLELADAAPAEAAELRARCEGSRPRCTAVRRLAATRDRAAAAPKWTRSSIGWSKRRTRSKHRGGPDNGWLSTR